jgi:uroporphyrin-III C-methyltransferase
VTPRVGAGEAPTDWIRVAANADTTVMYMAAGQASAIAGQLIDEGMPAATPVVIVENASLPQVSTTSMTLDALRTTGELLLHGGPALLMIGPVFADALNARAMLDAQNPARDLSPASRCA